MMNNQETTITRGASEESPSTSGRDSSLNRATFPTTSRLFSPLNFARFCRLNNIPGKGSGRKLEERDNPFSREKV